MRNLMPLFVAVAIVSRPALAGDVEKTVAQKDAWSARARMLEEKTRAVKDACGAQVTATFDKSSYAAFDPLVDRTEAPCRDVLNTLVALCASPAGKAGVAKVREVSCRFSSVGTKLTFEGHTLKVWIDPAKSSIEGLKKGSSSWKSALEELL
ncbi:MAG: hypothetical protein JNJ54_01605 [Myxococcaceae bacterium]|nr:hypothetical protein [Myxococcaceae bacterium]